MGIRMVTVGVQVGVAADHDGPAGTVVCDEGGELRHIIGLELLVLVRCAGFHVQGVHVDLQTGGERHRHHCEALHGQAVAGPAVTGVEASEATDPRNPLLPGEAEPGHDALTVADLGC